MNLAWIDSDVTKRRINKYGRRRRRSLGSDILGWILCHSLTLLTFSMDRSKNLRYLRRIQGSSKGSLGMFKESFGMVDERY